MRALLLGVAAALLTGCAAQVAPPVPVQKAAVPTSVDIPAIHARSSLIPLGLNPDRTVQTPPLDNPMQGGWYSLGVHPGDKGPAVLLAHVDAYGKPGLFFHLAQLKPGDVVHVGRADSSDVDFRITTVVTSPKTGFDAKAVYGDTPDPEIRLITCGGKLDSSAHSYLDNVIAFGVKA